MSTKRYPREQVPFFLLRNQEKALSLQAEVTKKQHQYYYGINQDNRPADVGRRRPRHERRNTGGDPFGHLQRI